MSSRSSGVVLVVLATLASGCAGLAGDDELDVPPPAPHERFVYEGPKETRLTVEVTGFAERVDHHLRVHDALILNISIETPHTGERPFTIWEAVDPGNGVLVQQTARCGWGIDGECTDERALVVLGSGGLPGGFGAAPLWRDSIEPGAPQITVPIERLDLTDATMTYTVGSANGTEEASPCVELTRPAVDRSVYRTYASSFRSPITVCDGIPLPVRFEAGLTGTFHLVDRSSGEGAPVATDTTTDWPDADPPVEPRPWSGTVPIHDPEDPSPFPVNEAHEAALENSKAYRTFLDRHPDALVLETAGRWEGFGQNLDLIQTETDERSVTAYGSQGEWMEISVERTRNSTGPEEDPVSEETTYEVRQTRTGNRVQGPDEAALAEEQAAVSEVYRVAEALTGQQPSRRTFYSYAGMAHLHQPLRGGEVNRTDGWTVRAYMEDPSPIGGGGGLQYRSPYQVSVDGPTGAVTYLTLNRSRLPLAAQAGVGGS